MEIIKFRAWDNTLKKMYEVVAIDWVDNQIISAHLKRNGEIRKVYPGKKYGDDIIFMQYTGLNDKNNKKIYEGDVLSTDLDRPYLIVEFKNGCFVFQCEDEGVQYYDIMTPINIEETFTKYHKIIGNIHDNPELLLKEDN